METKLLQKTEMRTKLPAGMIDGIELFWYNNEKWIILEGKAMRFVDSPAKLQNLIAELFLADFRSQALLKKIGITAFSVAFDRWYRCLFGALDEFPDIINGRINPDSYNSSCKDYKCVLRGRFCSRGPGLKSYEVESLVALKEGHTIEQAAVLLCISIAGMKSRVEKMKVKLGARNLPQLTAKAAELGI